MAPKLTYAVRGRRPRVLELAWPGRVRLPNIPDGDTLEVRIDGGNAVLIVGPSDLHQKRCTLQDGHTKTIDVPIGPVSVQLQQSSIQDERRDS